ncbi:hypothetical protein [Promicromonospora sp. NPDC057488]|uniref:hypothetical protein n=1 Tax=Promicromonospora sp. NPDC057488 TaxID=3346147 RepID=UPI003671D6E7
MVTGRVTEITPEFLARGTCASGVGRIMVLSETIRKGTSMKAVATIDTRAAVRGEENSQAREIEAEAATYEQARDILFGQVPEDWMIIGGIGVPDRADTYQPRRP